MGQREMAGTKMKRGRQPKGCFVPLNRDCNQKYQHPNGAAGMVDSEALRVNRNGVSGALELHCRVHCYRDATFDSKRNRKHSQT